MEGFSGYSYNLCQHTKPSTSTCTILQFELGFAVLSLIVAIVMIVLHVASELKGYSADSDTSSDFDA